MRVYHVLCFNNSRIWGDNLVPVNAFKPPEALAAVRPKGGGSVVVDSLLIITPIVGFCNYSMFCCASLCVHSSFAITSMGKRELVTLLCLSSWCLMIAVWLFLTMIWGLSAVCDCGIS